MIRYIFILSILISLIIVSKESHDDTVSDRVNGPQQQTNQTNITCLCTDKDCDSNTQTCRLTHPDHTCYESWRKEFNDDDDDDDADDNADDDNDDYDYDDMIRVTAGYEY